MSRLLLLLLLPLPALAEWHLLEADRITFEGSRIRAYHNAYMPEYTTGSGGEEWDYGAASEFDICLLCYNDWELFWDNRVYTYGTNNQVRHVGWYWELGATLYPGKVNAFYRHHSEHCMECDGPSASQRFPLLDEYVVEFVLYERD